MKITQYSLSILQKDNTSSDRLNPLFGWNLALPSSLWLGWEYTACTATVPGTASPSSMCVLLFRVIVSICSGQNMQIFFQKKVILL